jgi:transcriptional regulator with XRE-family HTH domain
LNGPGAFGFGAELAQLRAERGVSWEELARRARVSASYLKDIAAGRRGHAWPHQDIVEAIAAGLEVAPDYFLITRARIVLGDRDAIDTAYAATVSR